MSVNGVAGGFAPRDGVFGDGAEWRSGEAAPAHRRRFAILGVVACCALVGAILARDGGADPAATAVAYSWRTGFLSDPRLPPLIAFREADGAHARIRYEARSHLSDSERWDTLTVGEIGAEEALFQATLHVAKAAPPRPSLFVEIARQAADLDAAVVHATTPQTLPTGRGPLEWVAVTLSGPKAERACLGFRLDQARAIGLSGLACGARGAPIDAPALARSIDRLAPTNAGLQAGVGEILRGGGS